VRNVTNMSAMFSFATSFDQPLNWGEKTANVTDMSSMFSNATQMRRREHKVSAIKTAEPVSLGFNQDISDWNVSSVINMSSMFAATTAFNQDLSAWDVSSVTTMSNMFSNASAFNQPLNWGIKTANVTNMYAMFSQYVDQGGSVGVELQAKAAKAEPGSLGFNQDISSWDVSRVTNMYSMFASTAAFNQDLSAWNVSGVANMSSMFSNATAFNQPLNWATKTENVESMNNMFDGASAFNQDISGWFVDSVYSMENMLDNSGFSSENYDKLLTAYSAGILKDNVTLGAAGITYCNGAAGRTTLEGKGWNFVDGGIDCPPMLESTTPANNAIDVALDAVLVLTFDDYISVASGNIQINRKDKSLPALVIDITSSTLISTDSRAVKVKLGALTESLAYNTEYFITMDNEAVKGSGSKFFGGISSITTFSFTTVNKPLPTIVFEAIDATYGDAVITLNAISNSQGAISYSIVGDANEASISGDQLTIGNAGEITIKATVAEGQAHLGSSKEVTVTVAKANQTITFKAIDATYGDGAITLNATSDSQGAISYSIVGDANGASIDGNQLTLGNAGEITIKATVVTSLNHLGGSEEVTVTIAKASQTITFNVLKLDGSDIINLKGTASSGLPVTFTSSDVSVASIMGIEMTLLKIGLTTITAYQSGNDNYIAAESVEQELNIKYLAIGDYDTTGPVVSLYPNPAVNFIKIDLESSADINVKIFSVLGDLVLEKQNYVSKESISLSGLIEGVYFVKITVDNKQITKKIIKK
jgi:surface protein